MPAPEPAKSALIDYQEEVVDALIGRVQFILAGLPTDSPRWHDGMDRYGQPVMFDWPMAAPRQPDADQEAQVLLIDGDRGSGKSYVLRRVYDRLSRNPKKDECEPGEVPEVHCLPPMDPALLESDRTTIMEQIFAMIDDNLDRQIFKLNPVAGGDIQYLQRERAEDWASAEPSRLRSNRLMWLKRWLNDGVGRGWTFAQRFGQDVLSKDSAGYDDYVISRYREIRKTARRYHEWFSFLEHFLASQNCKLLAVFFDDFDLTPENFTEVIQAIRLYLRNKRIIVVMTAHLESATRKYEIDRMGEFRDTARLYDLFVNYRGKGKGNEDHLVEVSEILEPQDDTLSRLRDTAQRFVEHVYRERGEVTNFLTKLLPPPLRYELDPFGKSGVIEFAKARFEAAIRHDVSDITIRNQNDILTYYHSHIVTMLYPRDIIFMGHEIRNKLISKDLNKKNSIVEKFSNFDYLFRVSITKAAALSDDTCRKLSRREQQEVDYICYSKNAGPHGTIQVATEALGDDAPDSLSARRVPCDLKGLRVDIVPLSSGMKKKRSVSHSKYFTDLRLGFSNRDRHLSALAALYLSDLKLVRAQARRYIELKFDFWSGPKVRPNEYRIAEEASGIFFVQARSPRQLHVDLQERLAQPWGAESANNADSNRKETTREGQRFPLNAWSIVDILGLLERVQNRFSDLTVWQIDQGRFQDLRRRASETKPNDAGPALVDPAISFRTLLRPSESPILADVVARIRRADEAAGPILMASLVERLLVAWKARGYRGCPPPVFEALNAPAEQESSLYRALLSARGENAVFAGMNVILRLSEAISKRLCRFDRVIFMIADAVFTANGVAPETEEMRQHTPSEAPNAWIKGLATAIESAAASAAAPDSQGSTAVSAWVFLLIALAEPLRELRPWLDKASLRLIDTAVRRLSAALSGRGDLVKALKSAPEFLDDRNGAAEDICAALAPSVEIATGKAVELRFSPDLPPVMSRASRQTPPGPLLDGDLKVPKTLVDEAFADAFP